MSLSIIPMLLKDMEQEAKTTRSFLAELPDDKFGWQPHEKSMSIQQLANHLAELPGWVSFGLSSDELDFAKNHYEPSVMRTRAEVLAGFDKIYAEGRAALEASNEAELAKNWTMRSGETIYAVMTKAEVIRMALNQTIHHRAQLGVYYRLLGLPVPPSYGPTADFPSAY
jgi:uncharacterized damage-inducible protein DinB